MTRKTWAALLVSALGVAIVAGGRAAGPAVVVAQGAGPRVRPADHRDLSPALRDVRPLPPARGSVREMPRFRRATGARSRDPIVQSSPAPQLIAPPSTSFDGISNVNGAVPPDTNADVGPNHIVQWVNLSFAVYSKGSSTVPSTLLYGPAAGNTLWSGFGGPCETTNNGDPIVRYDHLADRWVMSQLSIPNTLLGLMLFPPFYECIAVSATPDPLGPYYRYQYSFDKLNDYPKLGVWPDAYYMAINQFSAPSLSYAGQGVVAFDRHAMLAGQAAAMIYFDLASVDMNLGGMLPSDLDGPPPPEGSPNYFVQIDDDAWGAAPDQLQVWRSHPDWATPSASSFVHAASLATAPFDSNLCNGAESCLTQPGTTATLDPMSDRLMYRLQYRNFGDHEALVVNHTVDADGNNHAGIRWYEIRDPGSSPWIYQQGTYAPDNDHRWMASAAMDGSGDLAIGFSVSSAATFPSVRYAARLPTDPLGVLAQGETDLVAGAGSQTHSSGRWGDYSLLAVDPVDDCTFWYTQEYYASTSSAGWRTRIGSFVLPGCVPTPASTLPPVTIAATTATATEAGLTNGIFTVTRGGDTSSALVVPYTTGGTAIAGSDYVALAGTLTIPAGASSATIDIVPVDDLAVEPNESVTVTLTAGPGYSVGTPGTALVTIVSDDLPADLVISALSVPAASGAGATIAITDTTANQGGGPAESSTTNYYLSKNATVDSSDPLIGSRTVSGLAVNTSESGTGSATIPAGTAAGAYYVIAKADGPALIAESVETNNTRSGLIVLGPDLTVSSVSAPSTAAPGGTIAISDTTTNRGAEGAGSSTTSFYLSANATLDGTDVPLGSRPVPALAASAASSATTTVSIPATVAAGAYYVIAQADSANVVAEAREANNLKFSSAVGIGADLAIAAVTASSTAGAGGPLTVTDTTKNQGAAAAGASTTTFYLSTNYGLDASDVLLGNRRVGALAAGASDVGTTSLTVPSGTATGTYYVIAKADAGNEVGESSETNNTRASVAVRVGPDLTVSALSAVSSKVAAGSSGDVNITISNAGGGAAGASTVRLYLSTNLAVDASDVLVGTKDISALAGGQTAPGTATIAIPSGQTAATYWLIAVADANGAVVETNESNNMRAISIQITVGQF